MGQLGRRRRFLEVLVIKKNTNDEPDCWSDFGSIVDRLCSLKKQQSRDWKCYIKKSNPLYKEAIPS